jgi:hypothetical protein
MSKVTYIPCLNDRHVQDSIKLSIKLYRVQSLVCVEGSDKRDLIPSDAAAMGLALIELAEEAGWRNPEADDGK